MVQVDTPENIWRTPADTFVAKALGQPEINLYDATVDDGALRVLGTELEVAIPADISISSSVGARIGIRPCDIEVSRRLLGKFRRGGACAAGLQLVERLGRNVELSIDLGGGVTMIGLSSGGSLAVEGAEIVVGSGSARTFTCSRAHQKEQTVDDSAAPIVGAGRAGESVTTYAAQEDGR